MGSTEVALRSTTGAVSIAQDWLPVFDIGQAVERRNSMVAFVQQIMVENVDYGTIPGTPKPSLLKAGAEKLCTFFGLSPEFILSECVEDWTGKDTKGEPFFYYRYKAKLMRGERVIGEGDGSCNSWESKHRYRWVSELQVPADADKTKLVKRGGTMMEFEFAIEKAETSGKYGKPAEHWQKFADAIQNKTARLVQKEMKNGRTSPAWEIDSTVYRVPNPDVADAVNTIQKMAQKRALVAATLIGVNASEYFTQDVEDLQQIDATYSVEHETPEPTRKAAAQPTNSAPPHTTPTTKAPAGDRTTIDQPGTPIPPALQSILSVMGSSKQKIQAEFSNMYMSLKEVAGDAGHDKYHAIIDQAGFDPASVKSVGAAQKCMAELYNALHVFLNQTHDQGPFQADDDDIPTELGGSYQGGPNPADQRRQEFHAHSKVVA